VQLLQAYLTAEYVVPTVGPPLRIGEPAAALEARHPGVTQFALLTAWNPGSLQLEPQANVEAGDALDKALVAARIEFVPALNRAPGGGHEEPSRLLPGLDPPRLDALARRFGQAGALAWRRGEAVRLRLYREDWRAEATAARVDTRFIDWVACAPT
jgi:hypothetical protein